jgi:Ca2+-transporting ATPase
METVATADAAGDKINSEKISARDLTMTFTTFIMFDMFNALACRHNSKSIFDIGFLSNKAFLAAMTFSLGGQVCLIYFPLFQSIFKTVALSFQDILFITTICSTMLIVDTIRKKYFSNIFTEALPSHYRDKATTKKNEKRDTFMV